MLIAGDDSHRCRFLAIPESRRDDSKRATGAVGPTGTLVSRLLHPSAIATAVSCTSLPGLNRLPIFLNPCVVPTQNPQRIRGDPVT